VAYWLCSTGYACSIALRVDYCASSILFTGDAEALEEADLAIDAPA
jgi:beta-lactamase superfamily II metal-dependent hydrolase